MRIGHWLSIPITLRVPAETGSAAMRLEIEQLRFVNEELRHRFKNMVAVIQSISRQTMHQTTTREDFDVRFSGRLGALGRSLDLLIDGDWHGVSIDELVRRELATFGHMDGMQISAEGPPVGLNPDAARNIGLALHELATNASKYGALSVPDGKVDLHWELTGNGARQRFHMSWSESGGPMVTEPKRWGFGRQVIQRLTALSLDGTVTHEFPSDGVTWTLDTPAAFVVSAAHARMRPHPRNHKN